MDPSPASARVNGVTFDGKHVWFASGDKLNALDPETGKPERALPVAGDAGTAFDGTHLYQIAEKRIQKIDPKTGRVLATIPAPGGGSDSGMALGRGHALGRASTHDRKIHQVDPETGKILRTIESNRHVTGVSWGRRRTLACDLGSRSERAAPHRPADRAVLEQLDMPKDVADLRVGNPTARTGSSAAAAPAGKLRAVKRPKR